jgi:predicted MPP superfamily phosphohydrolase
MVGIYTIIFWLTSEKYKIVSWKKKSLKTLKISFFLDLISNSLETAYVSLPCIVCCYKYIMVLLQKISDQK